MRLIALFKTGGNNISKYLKCLSYGKRELTIPKSYKSQENPDEVAPNNDTVQSWRLGFPSPKTAFKKAQKYAKNTCSKIFSYTTVNDFFECVFTFIFLLPYVINKVLTCVIIFYILEHFVPELRDKLPAVYKVMNLFGSLINSLFEFFLRILKL